MRQSQRPAEAVQRRNWAAQVGNDSRAAARLALVRAGFSDPTLLLHWQEIAGEETARIAVPLRLDETTEVGVLTLKTEPAASVFLQHEARALCTRINTYLGRQAVGRLRFVQGPMVVTDRRASLPAMPAEPSPDDPVYRFDGPESVLVALLKLARARGQRCQT